MPKQCNKSTAQRMELVLRLLRKEAPASQLAREAGVSENTLYRWRDQFLEGGRSQLGGKSKSPSGELATLKRELAERDQVIGELTIANRVLKKLSDNLS